MAALDRLNDAQGGGAIANVIRDAIGFYEYTRQQVLDEGRDVAFLQSGSDPVIVKLPFSVRQVLAKEEGER